MCLIVSQNTEPAKVAQIATANMRAVVSASMSLMRKENAPLINAVIAKKKERSMAALKTFCIIALNSSDVQAYVEYDTHKLKGKIQHQEPQQREDENINTPEYFVGERFLKFVNSVTHGD